MIESRLIVHRARERLIHRLLGPDCAGSGHSLQMLIVLSAFLRRLSDELPNGGGGQDPDPLTLGERLPVTLPPAFKRGTQEGEELRFALFSAQ